VIFAGSMLWLGIHVARRQERHLLEQAGRDLEAVADLKVRGIHHWHQGRP
jgi:hypothetical protein